MRSQHTLQKECIIEGKGLHTGENARLVCSPLSPNQGIQFVQSSSTQKESGVDNQKLNFGLGEGRRSQLITPQGPPIETVEHFFSALWALGISNLKVEVDGPEIPAMDGSAKDFVKAFQGAGVFEQEGVRKEVVIDEPIFVSQNMSSILLLPYHGLRISYTLDYKDKGIQPETLSFDLNQKEFIDEIASARTFCFEDEVEMLLKQGFGKGANYENTLVMSNQGPIQNQLRFKNECVRHKILDLIGDLSLLGCDIRAQVVAIRSGHELNHQVMEQIQSRYLD